MKDLIMPGLVLFITCVVVALGLGATNHITGPLIEKMTLENDQKARKEVLPEAVNFVNIYTGTPKELETDLDPRAEVRLPKGQVFKALGAAGEPVGLVAKVFSKGYGGEVPLVIGLNSSGKITGIKPGAHKETPGLGDKILLADGKVMKQLLGLTPAGPLTTVKGKKAKAEDIDAVAGSTITSRAVVRGAEALRALAQTLAKGAQP